MIELIRDDLSKAGQHGVFDLEGDTWHSLEQPDLGNLPFRSCVPLGDYELRPFTSPKYGACFIMVNEDLNVYEFEHSPGRPTGEELDDDGEPIPAGRYLCLFTHRGNYVKNFRGCCGAGFDYLEDQDMITNTRKACAAVNNAVIQEASYKLRISHQVE
jgi:hypothetical protein